MRDVLNSNKYHALVLNVSGAHTFYTDFHLNNCFLTYFKQHYGLPNLAGHSAVYKSLNLQISFDLKIESETDFCR